MFIESCRILYTGPSDDYIFPARDRVTDGESTFYYNLNRKAKPLACVDWLEVCQSDGTCRHIDQESKPHEVEYELVRAAMRKATTYSAIEFRRGSALLAKECVADLISQQLDDHQWILESVALFETSLSRIQHDALDIAIGFGHEKAPGLYVHETLDWARGNMCGLYKFKIPAGFLNVAFWPNVTTFVVAGKESRTMNGKDGCRNTQYHPTRLARRKCYKKTVESSSPNTNACCWIGISVIRLTGETFCLVGGREEMDYWS